MLPLSKQFFYISEHSVQVATANPGYTEYKPTVETCVPLHACSNATGFSKTYVSFLLGDSAADNVLLPCESLSRPPFPSGLFAMLRVTLLLQREKS